MTRIYYPTCDPAPDPVKGPREFRLDQLEAIYRILHAVTDPEPGAYHSALVGAGMGSGKTVISCEVILKMKPRRTLIVGVKDSYKQYADQFRDQQDGPKKVPMLRIDGTEPGMKNLAKLLDGDPGVFYVGLEMLRAQDWEKVSETWEISAETRALFSIGAEIEMSGTITKQKQKNTYASMPPVDLLISDEAHKHSNQKSASIKTVRTIPARAKIALSGTFFGNRFENAWALCVWLWDKKVIGGKGAWERQWAISVPILDKDGEPVRTPGGFALSKIVGEQQPGEFVQTLPCYVYIPSPLGDPPEPEIVKVELGPESRRQYNELERMSLTWIPTIHGPDHEPLIADLDLTQRIRLRTAALGAMTLVPGKDDDDPDSTTFEPGCESTTLNLAYDILHRPSWRGKKALILTHSKPFAEEAARRIAKKYPGRVFLKTGDTKNWEAMKESFMQPVGLTGVQYLVAVIAAVGTSTDGLQQSCAKVLWLSEDESNVVNIQGSNRVWRDGVDLDEYEAVKIVQADTIAEGVLKKNRAHKKRTLDSVQGAK